MSLRPGESLAQYRIERKIGEGGMGEVWAATDTRLHRAAAIKSLPAAVAADPERLARFQREAQLLAALSHPNIAGVYGLEQRGETPYLILELVESEDLSARIARGAIPVEEAIELALQIAAALEAAHDKGIIHRDLKPGNIKVTADGTVKVLDFGLAKALSDDPPPGDTSLDLSRSPTMTAAMGTQAGVILGTAGYMSPEQARGKPVDRRADVWAFGVVLFEMLTGHTMFRGETVTDIIAAVVTREPDWAELPAATPRSVRRLLRRCLQKDPRRRLRDLGDAALELRDVPEEEDASAVDGTASGPSRRTLALVGVGGLALGLLAATGIDRMLAPDSATPSPIWTTVSPPAGTGVDFFAFLEISPDGRRIAFVARAPGADENQLWVRELDEEQPRALAGTEGAQQPIWSPDSRSIAYFAKRKLRRIGVNGGVSQALADCGAAPRGGSWGANATILYVPDWSEPVYSIPESGGEPAAITRFNKERLELSHRWPLVLPDGKHFLYFIVSTYPQLNPENPSELDKSGLYVASFDGGEPRMLTAARSRAAYTGGSLLYVDDGILQARPFDLGSLTFTAEPQPLIAEVTQSVNALWGGALFSVSNTGTLLFVRGASERDPISMLQARDRTGKLLETFGDPQPYRDIRISHDGTRLVSAIGDPADLWIHDLARGTATRFTFDPGNDLFGVWSPDDSEIYFQSDRVVEGETLVVGNLFRKGTTGSQAEEHLPTSEDAPIVQPTDVTADGLVVGLAALNPGTGSDIVLFDLTTNTASVFVGTRADEDTFRFSPNGKWIVYESTETGRQEIYVAAYPGPGGKWQISRDGGRLPMWSPDGTELYFVTDEGIHVAPVETAGEFRHGSPRLLFEIELTPYREGQYPYDITPDGQRFLVLSPEGDESAAASITLLQNWPSLLE